jgi:RNA polymerase sigma-70 factor (ECF subfamily)
MADRHALEEIVHKYYERVFAYCLAILTNRERAEDACHDVFLKVQSNIEKLDHRKNCAAWLLRIARNHCYDVYRKEKRLLLCEDVGNTVRERGLDPEERLLEKERMAMIVDAVNNLQPAYREVLVLRDFSGFSYQSIAHHLGIDRKRVKWMLHKARKRLKRIVGGESEED